MIYPINDWLALRPLQDVQVTIGWSQFKKLGDASFARVSASKVETVDVDIRNIGLTVSYRIGG